MINVVCFKKEVFESFFSVYVRFAFGLNKEWNFADLVIRRYSRK